MKLEIIVRAQGPLTRLLGQVLPIRTAWELTKLVDRINVPLQFFTAELAKQNTTEHMDELCSMDVDFEVGARPQINLSEPVLLSAVDVHALKPFIEFIEEAE